MNQAQSPRFLGSLNKPSSISTGIGKNPKISVIICAYTTDRLKDIHEAVNSVLDQTLKPCEGIIAVDHNEELYQELAETYKGSANLNQSPNPNESLSIPFKLILNTGTRGLSETRNVGIRAAVGEIVAFIDDDALAKKDWLENLVKPFSPWSGPETRRNSLVTHRDSVNFSKPKRRVVAVGGRAIPLWHNDKRPSWFPEELGWIIGCTYKGLPVSGDEIRNVPGCNMAFVKDIFHMVGFFRTELGRTGETKGVAEEPELCLRIKHRMPDSLILHKPEAIIYHKVPSRRLSLKYIIQRSYDEGFCKAKVRRLSSIKSQNPLSTEGSYLRYLLFKFIPQKLAHFYKKDSLVQVGAVITSIGATGLGYLVYRLRQGVRTTE